MKKRITSFVMAILMLISLLPTNVFAVTVDENGVSVYELGDSKWLPAGQTPADATAEGTAWSPVYGEDDNQLTKQGLCDQAEHTHNYNCADDCALAHTHADECYTTVYACGLEANDGHVHGNACYEKVCTLEETVGHVHGMTCKALTCTDTTEGHVHAETCYDMTGADVCGIEAGAGAHAHEAKCYNLEKLVCTTEIGAGAHAHTEECAPVTSLTCELAEHTCVTDGCAADCAIAEHTHTAECDMETTYVKWEVTAQMMTLAAEDETTYEVTLRAKSNGSNQDGVTLTIYQQNADGTYATTPIATVTTEREGYGYWSDKYATAQLPAGSYKVVASGAASSTTDWVGEATFTVDGAEEVTVSVSTERSYAAAERVYDSKSSFDHVDTRVNGSITVGGVSYDFTLKNARTTITDNGTSTTYDFSDDTDETYEWRVEGSRNNRLSVSKNAVITVVFDVYIDGELVWDEYTVTYSGKEDFVKAIQICDGFSGLDFRIDETELVKDILPDLTVEKVDQYGNPVSGAEFTLTGTATKTVTTGANGVASFEDLPVGSYELKETKTPDGYQGSYSATFEVKKTKEEQEDSGHTHTATIYYSIVDLAGLEDGTITVENTKIDGKLTVKKEFGTDSALKDQPVTITVTGPNNYTNTFSLNNTDGWSATLEGLAFGEYTVTETATEVAGYILTSDKTTDTVELSDSTEKVVTFTNTYTMKTTTEQVLPSLTVKKVDNYGEALEGATFTATMEGGMIDATSDASGVATFEKLAPGSYTLTETKAPAGYTASTASYTFDVVKVSSVTSAEPNAEGYFVVTDTYEIQNLTGVKEDGSIEIENTKNEATLTSEYPTLTVKKVDQDGNALAGAEFTVTGPNEFTAKTTTGDNGLIGFQLPLAGEYTLTETDAPYGYTGEATYTFSVVVDEEKSYENVLNEETNKFETKTFYKIEGLNLTNGQLVVENTEILGSLTITKDFVGLEKGHAPEEITVNVTGTDYTGAEYSNEVKLNETNEWTVTLSELKLGEYTVEETVDTAAVVGYELINTEYAPETVELTEEAVDGEIVITNTYDKKIVNVHGDTASFTVKKVDQDNKPLAGATFTLTGTVDGQPYEKVLTTDANGEVKFEELTGNLKDGSKVTYTLEETAAPAGYAKTDSTWTVTVEEDGGEAKLVLKEDKGVFENIWDWVTGETTGSTWDGNGNTLTVTNNIIKGSLTITKVFAPYTPVDVEDGVNITVTGPEGYTKMLTLKEGALSETLTDLLPGVYTITEDAESAEAFNYAWTMSVEGAEKADADYTYTVEVPMATTEPGSAEVTITNSYTLYGSAEFMVHKTGVNGDVVLDEILAGAKFGLFNENGDEVDSQITDDRGNAFFVIMEEGTYTLKETEAPEGYLLNDTEYTVEVILDGENYDVPTYVATIEGAENGVLIVENQHITGEITIIKDFEYDVAEGFEVMPEEITVTVDGEEYVLNAENEWSVTVENLLPGEYTISEDTESAMFQGYTLGVTYNGEDTGVIEVPAQNGAVVEMAIVNTYTQEFNDDTHVPASFVVYKEDEDGNALEGAEFTLYNEEGQIFEVVTTAINEEGKAVAVFDELYGIKETKEAVTYTLKETAAPAGYTPIDTEWTVIVEEDDGEVRIEIEENADKFDKFWDWIIGEGSDVDGVLVVENEQTVLTINTDLAYTLNGVASEKLDGMEVPETEYTYTITYKVGEEEKSETVTVAEGEQEKVYGIPVGAAYTITVDTTAEYFDSTVAYETRSGVMPETGVTEADVLHTYNYFTVDVTKEVVVEKNGINVPETILNTILGNKTYAMLLSTYDVNGLMDGTEVLDVAAGETKTFETILLMGAKYDVHEGVTSEDAYVPSYEVDEENHEVTVTNTYTFVEGVDLEIDMIKTASNKKRTPLAGAKFTLKDADGDVMGYYTSAKDGTFVIDEITEPGTYTLTETKAPDGYYKLNKAVTIEIGEIYTVTTGPDEEPIIVRDLVVEDVKNGKVEDLDDGSFRIKNDEITDNSKTGDQFNTVLWVGLGATAAAALVILLILGKKRAR